MKTDSNKELYNFLKIITNENRLPVMDSTLFTIATEKYGRDVFRSTVAEYITNEKPLFPYKEFSYDELVSKFRKLKSTDYSDYISPVENLQKEVIEKYDDYKYSFK